MISQDPTTKRVSEITFLSNNSDNFDQCALDKDMYSGSQGGAGNYYERKQICHCVGTVWYGKLGTYHEMRATARAQPVDGQIECSTAKFPGAITISPPPFLPGEAK